METKVIAIDVGYGNTKAVWKNGIDKLGRERWGEICFRSVAPLALVDEKSSGMSHSHNKVLLSINDRNYYAGPGASLGIESRALDPNYIESDEHEALLRASLHFAMRDMNCVFEEIDMLVVGLPVLGFNARSKRLEQIASQPRAIPVPGALQEKGHPESITVTAKQVKVLPQPYGALRYAAQHLPEDDEMFADRALSMVIDPGYRTFDWFFANSMMPELKLSGSFDGGVSSILRQVSHQIGHDHGTGSLEFDQVEEGLTRGRINLGYQVIDTGPYQSTVLDAARKEVLAFLSRIDANKSRLSRVFLAGGGAHYYRQALQERLPGYDIQLLNNSVMSNARGYWLSGCDDFQD